MSSIIIIKVCLSDLIYTDNQYRQALAAYVYAINLVAINLVATNLVTLSLLLSN